MIIVFIWGVFAGSIITLLIPVMIVGPDYSESTYKMHMRASSVMFLVTGVIAIASSLVYIVWG